VTSKCFVVFAGKTCLPEMLNLGKEVTLHATSRDDSPVSDIAPSTLAKFGWRKKRQGVIEQKEDVSLPLPAEFTRRIVADRVLPPSRLKSSPSVSGLHFNDHAYRGDAMYTGMPESIVPAACLKPSLSAWRMLESLPSCDLLIPHELFPPMPKKRADTDSASPDYSSQRTRRRGAAFICCYEEALRRASDLFVSALEILSEASWWLTRDSRAARRVCRDGFDGEVYSIRPIAVTKGCACFAACGRRSHDPARFSLRTLSAVWSS